MRWAIVGCVAAVWAGAAVAARGAVIVDGGFMHAHASVFSGSSSNASNPADKPFVLPFTSLSHGASASVNDPTFGPQSVSVSGQVQTNVINPIDISSGSSITGAQFGHPSGASAVISSQMTFTVTQPQIFVMTYERGAVWQSSSVNITTPSNVPIASFGFSGATLNKFLGAGQYKLGWSLSPNRATGTGGFGYMDFTMTPMAPEPGCVGILGAGLVMLTGRRRGGMQNDE